MNRAASPTAVGQSGLGSCAKHAVVCRLHNTQATSNLQRIKDSDRSTYGPLTAPFAAADYGALKDRSPSSSAASLIRRWSVVRGLIEDPSNTTAAAAASRLTSSSYPRYCLHSSRLQPQTIALSTAPGVDGGDDDPPAGPGIMYFPLCSQQQQQQCHHHHHHRVPFINSPPQSTYSCGQSAPSGKISGPPDVIASPEAETVYCFTAAAGAEEDQVAAWDWRTTAEESATNRDYFFTDAEKTAPSNGNWMMTSHDVESTKMTLLKQTTTTTTDNEIL